LDYNTIMIAKFSFLLILSIALSDTCEKDPFEEDLNTAEFITDDSSNGCALSYTLHYTGKLAGHFGGFTVVVTGPFTLRVPGATRFSDKFSGVDFKLSAFRNYEKMILFSGGDNEEESKHLLYLN